MSAVPPLFQPQQIPISSPAKPLSPQRLIGLLMLLLLIGVMVIRGTAPRFHGDAAEYTLMTTAIAEHGSVEIRPSDVAVARPLFSEYAWFHQSLEDHWNNGGTLPPGFLTGRDGQVHAIHYFGYSALAAIPFKICQLLGQPPTKSFLWLDWFCLLVLAYAAYRYGGTLKKTGAILAIFMLTVGLPYWNCASPELFSAALALAALLLMAGSSFAAAGLLIALAAGQNPPLLALLFIGPVFVWIDRYLRLGKPAISAILHQENRTSLALGIVLGCAIGLAPIYFSFKFFDTWNVIATGATDPRLVSLQRLFSYYFDLNQGMMIAVPGVWLLIAYATARRPRLLWLLAPTALCSLAMAIPALSTQNWNSGSAGMMRYIAWGAVPIVFLMLSCLRHLQRAPVTASAVFVFLQALCIWHSTRYVHTEFSPVARWVLRHAPALYNPEPEVFIDRATHAEPIIDYDSVYRFDIGGKSKTLFYAGSAKSISALCPVGLPYADSTVKASYDGWTYLNGKVRCDGVPLSTAHFGIDAFQAQTGAQLLSGWSRFEIGTPAESGVWSIGKASTLLLQVPTGKPNTITIRGRYLGGNTRTEIIVNGKSLGAWHLDRPNRISLAQLELGSPPRLQISLRHQAPRSPSAQDTRELAFFLQRVEVEYRGG